MCCLHIVKLNQQHVFVCGTRAIGRQSGSFTSIWWFLVLLFMFFTFKFFVSKHALLLNGAEFRSDSFRYLRLIDSKLQKLMISLSDLRDGFSHCFHDIFVYQTECWCFSIPDKLTLNLSQSTLHTTLFIHKLHEFFQVLIVVYESCGIWPVAYSRGKHIL